MLIIYDRIFCTEIEGMEQEELKQILKDAPFFPGPYCGAGAYVDVLMYESDDLDELDEDAEDIILVAWRKEGQWQAIPFASVYFAEAELGFTAFDEEANYV